MDVSFIWLFVCMIFYIISLANGFKIKTVIFRVRGKRHDARKCAMDILNDDFIIGSRIADKTGKCEKQTRSSDEFQTTEPGYGYVEKVYTKKGFQPAISPERLATEDGIFNFTGPLKIGSRLDFNFARTSPVFYHILLMHGEGSKSFWSLSLSVREKDSEMGIVNGNALKGRVITFDGATMCPLNECKFSLVISDGKIQILVGDHYLQNSTTVVELAILREMGKVVFSASSENDITFNSFEFTK
ncbi:uncharacterized protein LOC132716735 [Ruditapes philippinarum]|uniref:uncharacterized protein LOC132716735 n=1 Tax=Ruditapes philippinarum TaxID=129788 RepID=UPI00295AE578|nr:uncharacterized protein LOC132716735 [Ruditapes philippinarum]